MVYVCTSTQMNISKPSNCMGVCTHNASKTKLTVVIGQDLIFKDFGFLLRYEAA